MKAFVPITFIAYATLCAAQAQFANLPSCAKQCAASLPANCHLDVKCICSDQSFITGISCCVKDVCPLSDQQKTLQVAGQLCDTVDVTLPSAASCPSGASTGTGAAESTSPFSTGLLATTKQSGAIVGPQATVSSAVSDASDTAMSATRAVGDMTTSATGSPTSSTAELASSASTVAATGAAQILGTNMGAVGAAMAAFAFL